MEIASREGKILRTRSLSKAYRSDVMPAVSLPGLKPSYDGAAASKNPRHIEVSFSRFANQTLPTAETPNISLDRSFMSTGSAAAF